MSKLNEEPNGWLLAVIISSFITGVIWLIVQILTFPFKNSKK